VNGPKSGENECFCPHLFRALTTARFIGKVSNIRGKVSRISAFTTSEKSFEEKNKEIDRNHNSLRSHCSDEVGKGSDHICMFSTTDCYC